MNQPAIELMNVYKRFQLRQETITALNNIQLSIHQGEFFTIVGPSGCGKTTLLRILAGLDKATSGEVKLFDRSNYQPLNSMVFQEQSVFPWLTVLDNVQYGLKLRGVPKHERLDTAKHFITMMGLTPFMHAYPSELSGGMKQRVSVARAFANDPKILLMDEPFGALDEQNRILLQQELLKIWEKNKKTTVFITHSIDEALCLSDRVLIMTAHPGSIKSIIPITIPRPRDISAIRTTPLYHDLYQNIWLQLREEVMKYQKMQKIHKTHSV